jgi:SOS-response transcriptional repressor LexA
MQKRAWAEDAVAKLQAGQVTQVRPTGHSMQGRLDEGDLVTLAPCDSRDLAIGDIVLARVKGRHYSHLVLHLVVERESDRFLIGNNHGRRDGWITAEDIFGKVTQVQSPSNETSATA